METQVVKYHNVVNQMCFKSFTENDFNFFMAICARMKELGETTQQLEYSYIMDLVGWDKRQRIDLFHEELQRMSDKLRQVGATITLNPDEFVSFNLFSTFRGNKQKKILTIKVNPDFRYILYDLTRDFTKFELREYISLDGRYSKLLYQHLKQFRSTGWWRISIEDMRRVLAIPDSYQNKHIMDKVIKPAIPLLKGCKGFGDLSVERIQDSGRGKALKGFVFKWTPENQIPGQTNIHDAMDEMAKYKAEKRKETGSPKFNDFEQRNYSHNEMQDLERKLAQMD